MTPVVKCLLYKQEGRHLDPQPPCEVQANVFLHSQLWEVDTDEDEAQWLAQQAAPAPVGDTVMKNKVESN